MTDRFGRNYELVVGEGLTAVIIKPPMRIVFSCSKSGDGQGVNRMSCRIYNLKSDTRLRLVKDAEDLDKYIKFQLMVGYGDTIETIFKGSVHVGHNRFEMPDHVTTLESLDGGVDFLKSYTSATVKGSSAAVNQLLKDMPNTEIGKITNLANLSRPKVLVGNSIECLSSMLDPDTNWYIDSEQLYVVRGTEVTQNYIPVLSASTGLLNTPERQNRIVGCETMMNPALRIGGRCELKSKNAPHLNAVYKIYSIEYNGDYEGQDWKQSIKMIADEGFTVL